MLSLYLIIMLQSHLTQFTRKEAPRDEESLNAQLLLRAGFIDKLMAGVYSYLPLGLRVLQRITQVVREEMDGIGGQEVLMPVLHPKENWQTTGRWDGLDVLFKIISRDKREYALGPTHEEIIVPLAQKSQFSYKDMPFGLYQIQTKFRDEARAKSGLMRGREFLMKDLYSFHPDAACLQRYYDMVAEAYTRIFSRLGLHALKVEASGGTFSKFSHEFQVLTPNGEDEIIHCSSCSFANNREITELKEGDACPSCGALVRVSAGSEVGNIFQLNTKYSKPFNLTFKDAAGAEHDVLMGCYGIGISRLMGVIAEVSHDDKGLVWPASVAPFAMHLIALQNADAAVSEQVYARARGLYEDLCAQGVDVLFDDRTDVSAGEKFAESDLIGIPVRLVISAKTGDKVEIKRRGEAEASLVDFSQITQYVTSTR